MVEIYEIPNGKSVDLFGNQINRQHGFVAGVSRQTGTGYINDRFYSVRFDKGQPLFHRRELINQNLPWESKNLQWVPMTHNEVLEAFKTDNCFFKQVNEAQKAYDLNISSNMGNKGYAASQLLFKSQAQNSTLTTKDQRIPRGMAKIFDNGTCKNKEIQMIS